MGDIVLVVVVAAFFVSGYFVLDHLDKKNENNRKYQKHKGSGRKGHTNGFNHQQKKPRWF